MNTKSSDAILVKTKEELFSSNAKPCSFIITNSEHGFYISFICPAKEGDFRHLPISTGKKIDGRWLWSGNFEKPTLSPSIFNYTSKKEPQWHGHLTDGKFISC
jgi:Family of unknown function (DUF6527)